MNVTSEQYRVTPDATRALRTRFWEPGGWRPQRLAVQDPRVAPASAAGLLLEDEVRSTHDEVVRRVRSVTATVTADAVRDAFLASLSSGRLDLRSALASWAIARHLPAHASESPGACAVCDLPAGVVVLEPAVYNFERFTWGGVRRDDLGYVLVDLEQFRRAPQLRPSPEDLHLAARLLDVLANLPAGTTPARAVASLRFLPGNDEQRRVLLQLLGVLGVLKTPGHPSFRDEFVAAADRCLPTNESEDDYPAAWWRAEFGLGAAAARDLLPDWAPA